MTPEKAAAEPAQPFTAPDPLAGDWSRLATPEDWLAYLRKLIAGRRLDDARRSVEELKRRWPATELPEDIAAPLTAASR